MWNTDDKQQLLSGKPARREAEPQAKTRQACAEKQNLFPLRLKTVALFESQALLTGSRQ